ncbi:hypothetical protein ACFO4E_25280 [Nocardiopsis mangrovi]|uniref:Uncharacterized protein n=1 Tax=Nocardiopsis mangrovi TaxID=1179818 RepID=A0ABV9E6C9_9ACTN
MAPALTPTARGGGPAVGGSVPGDPEDTGQSEPAPETDDAQDDKDDKDD